MAAERHQIRAGVGTPGFGTGRSWLVLEPTDACGDALVGALAPAVLAREFEAAGYRVWSEDSSWQLAADNTELQLYLLQGYMEAASEQNPNMSDMIEEWAERRRSHTARGQSKLVVGHRDVIARLD